MSYRNAYLAALGAIGILAAGSSIASAQQTVIMGATPYAAPYVDCYYNTNHRCDGYVDVTSYGYGPRGAYASMDIFAPTAPFVSRRWIMRGLTGADWVAIHGAGR
jgi:hypothetical protein